MAEKTGKKRFICSFVKLIDGKLIPDVVVIPASNNIIARADLCQRYGVKNLMIDRDRLRDNAEEGIKTIRLAETNTYEGDTSHENFISDDS